VRAGFPRNEATKADIRLKRFGHFFEDGGGSFGGVGGLGDGPAYDEVAGSEAKSFGRTGDAFLVADGRAGGADAGYDEDSFRACEGSECSNLLGRADESADACFHAHLGEEFNLRRGEAANTGGVKLAGVHAGEDGYGE